MNAWFFSGLLLVIVAVVGSLWAMSLRSKLLEMRPVLLAIASGLLVGTGVFHLLPQAMEALGPSAFLWASLGALSFWGLAKTVDSFSQGGAMTVVVGLLVGDSLHNLLEGASMAEVFALSEADGWMSWLGVLGHEIPQELSEMGVYLSFGLSMPMAVFLNGLSASMYWVGGGLRGWFLADGSGAALGAGGLFYLGVHTLTAHIFLTKKSSVVLWGLWPYILFAGTLLVSLGFSHHH